MNLTKTYNSRLKKVYKIKDWSKAYGINKYEKDLKKVVAYCSSAEESQQEAFRLILHIRDNVYNIDFKLLSKNEYIYLLKGFVNYNNKEIGFEITVDETGIEDTGKYALERII